MAGEVLNGARKKELNTGWKIMQNRRQWFLDRIGKTVYRNKLSCTCLICQSVYDNGLFIEDEMQADYLWDMEGCYAHDNVKLRYFDTKEEVKQYEENE